MNAIVAGTGHQNKDGSSRIATIRNHCCKGRRVFLEREPDNPYDKNAIAVYLDTSLFFGIFKSRRQIGYIKTKRAQTLAARMDKGEKFNAVVASFYAPAGRYSPRVTLEIKPF